MFIRFFSYSFFYIFWANIQHNNTRRETKCWCRRMSIYLFCSLCKKKYSCVRRPVNHSLEDKTSHSPFGWTREVRHPLRLVAGSPKADHGRLFPVPNSETCYWFNFKPENQEESLPETTRNLRVLNKSFLPTQISSPWNQILDTPATSYCHHYRGTIERPLRTEGNPRFPRLCRACACCALTPAGASKTRRRLAARLASSAGGTVFCNSGQLKLWLKRFASEIIELGAERLVVVAMLFPGLRVCPLHIDIKKKRT